MLPSKGIRNSKSVFRCSKNSEGSSNFFTNLNQSAKNAEFMIRRKSKQVEELKHGGLRHHPTQEILGMSGGLDSNSRARISQKHLVENVGSHLRRKSRSIVKANLQAKSTKTATVNLVEDRTGLRPYYADAGLKNPDSRLQSSREIKIGKGRVSSLKRVSLHPI